MDQLPVGIIARGAQRPKFEKATCKGSFALGTACGRCERCDWERANPMKPPAALSPDSGLTFLQVILGHLVFCRDCGDFVGFRINQRQIVCTRAAHPVVSFSE